MFENVYLVSRSVFDVDEVLVVRDGLVLGQLEDSDQGLQQLGPEARVGAGQHGRSFAEQSILKLKLQSNLSIAATLGTTKQWP